MASQNSKNRTVLLEKIMTVLAEHRKFLERGGYFQLPRKFIKISGPDRTDFLHRLTTQNIKELRVNFGAEAALLKSDGTIISLFDVYNFGHFLLLVVDDRFHQHTLDELERMHFGEDLEIFDFSDELTFFSVQGVTVENDLASLWPQILESGDELSFVEDFISILDFDFSPVTKGFHFFVKPQSLKFFKEHLKRANLEELSEELWTLLRVEAGYFKMGTDIDERHMILEAPLVGTVAFGKGCYPGQEVVERVVTYGRISKKLVGLKRISGQEQNLGKLFSGGENAGYLTSATYLPWSRDTLFRGVVRKPFFEEAQVLTTEDGKSQFEVEALPFTFEIEKPKTQESGVDSE